MRCARCDAHAIEGTVSCYRCGATFAPIAAAPRAALPPLAPAAPPAPSPPPTASRPPRPLGLWLLAGVYTFTALASLLGALQDPFSVVALVGAATVAVACLWGWPWSWYAAMLYQGAGMVVALVVLAAGQGAGAVAFVVWNALWLGYFLLPNVRAFFGVGAAAAGNSAQGPIPRP